MQDYEHASHQPRNGVDYGVAGDNILATSSDELNSYQQYDSQHHQNIISNNNNHDDSILGGESGEIGYSNDDGENDDQEEQLNVEGGKKPKHWIRRVFIFIEYPISTWFIMFAELCERFSFYGFKTILSLYLLNYLKFDQDASTSIVHAFVFFAYCK